MSKNSSNTISSSYLCESLSVIRYILLYSFFSVSRDRFSSLMWLSLVTMIYRSDAQAIGDDDWPTRKPTFRPSRLPSFLPTSNLADGLICQATSENANLWTMILVTNYSDSISSISNMEDGDYMLIGGTHYSYSLTHRDILTVKLNQYGALIWSKIIGGYSSDYGSVIIQTSDGGYLLSGTTHSYGAGYADILVAKFTKNFNLSWAMALGNDNNDHPASLIETKDGSYLLVGRTYFQHSVASGSRYYLLATKLATDGTVIWSKAIGGRVDNRFGHSRGISIIETSDGGYIVSGRTSTVGAGSHDLLLVKFANNGEVSWLKTLGSTSYDNLESSIILDGDNYFLVAAYAAGYDAALVARLTVDGEIDWLNTYSGDLGGYVRSFTHSTDGGYLFTSYTSSANSEYERDRDILLVKLSHDGLICWVKSISVVSNSGNIARTRSARVTTDQYGNYILTDLTSYGTDGEHNVLVMKLDGNGNAISFPGLHIKDRTSDFISAKVDIETVSQMLSIENITFTSTNITQMIFVKEIALENLFFGQPSIAPSSLPSVASSHSPTFSLTISPSLRPSYSSTYIPTLQPSFKPTRMPSKSPTHKPTLSPTKYPTRNPSFSPTQKPSFRPTYSPTYQPSLLPTSAFNSSYIYVLPGAMYDLQQTSAYGVIVTGSLYARDHSDIFVTEFSAAGQVMWSRLLGHDGDEAGYSICPLTYTDDSSYLVVGSSLSFGASTPKVLLARLSLQGKRDWVKTMTGVAGDVAYSAAQLSDGRVLVAGRTESYGAGSSDGLLLQLDIAGNLLWSQAIGGVDADEIRAMKVTSDDEVFLVGYTTSDNGNAEDILIVKLGAAGQIIWQKTLGTLADERAVDLQVTNVGDVIVVGKSVATQQSNVLFAKLSGVDGSLMWANTLSSDGWSEGLSLSNYLLSGFAYIGEERRGFTASISDEGSVRFLKGIHHEAINQASLVRAMGQAHIVAGAIDESEGHSFMMTIDEEGVGGDQACEGTKDISLHRSDVTDSMSVRDADLLVANFATDLLSRNAALEQIKTQLIPACEFALPDEVEQDNNNGSNDSKNDEFSAQIQLIIMVLGSASVALCLVGIVWYMCAHKNLKKQVSRDPEEGQDSTIELTQIHVDNDNFSEEAPPIPFIKWSELIIGEELGRGGFCKVNKAMWGERHVAVKQLLPSRTNHPSMMNEITILSRLSYPNIVGFHGQSYVNADMSFPAIVLPLFSGGNLRQYLENLSRRSPQIPWSLHLRMAHELSKGLAYLHSQGVIHRDIKSPNVLLDADKHVKWCDFGISHARFGRSIHTQTNDVRHDGAGTYNWMAPEAIRHDPISTQSDIWSLGMVFYELASLRKPFSDRRFEDERVLKNEILKERGEDVPLECDEGGELPQFGGLMRDCWQMFNSRPTAAQIEARAASLLGVVG